MRNVDDEIHKAMEIAQEYEIESDRAFARGDVLAGSKFFRWSVLAYRLASDLSRDDARRRLAAH